MKNNKGFTLIELLAVVAILITVVAILTPKIFKQFKTAENITNQEQINSLINTAKIYMNQNSNLLPEENNIYIISLNELKHSGLIQTKEILNPSTKQELTGCIIVKYENNKYKYEYKEENDCNNVITVTFDPQGGQLDQTTKQVIPNDTYGTLPTPTKEGYTFMGWNGKNLIYIFDCETTVNGVTAKVENGVIELSGTNTNTNTNYGIRGFAQNLPILESNTNYTLSLSNELTSGAYSQLNYWRDTGVQNGLINQIKKGSATINISSVSDYDRLAQFFVGIYATATELNETFTVQLEEGDTATEYEPYYITNDTTVVQDKNHTLKAIWKANE